MPAGSYCRNIPIGLTTRTIANAERRCIQLAAIVMSHNQRSGSSMPEVEDNDHQDSSETPYCGLALTDAGACITEGSQR